MSLLAQLQTDGGLAVLHLVQTILFGAMVYILAAEYFRTLKSDLVYKLVASFSITLLNFFSAGIYYLKQFEDLQPGDEFFPLIHNTVFVVIVLALARAFIYDFLAERNQRRFDLFFHSNLIGIGIAYFGMQFYWLQSPDPGRGFHQSWLQLLFVIYFVFILIFLIVLNLKYRERFAWRISIAFMAIIVAQLVNLWQFFNEHVPGGALVLQAIVPVLVPGMFGSVVFKELIASNTKMLQDLKHIMETQKGVIHEMEDLSVDLERLSGNLTEKATSSWTRLLDMKSIVEKESHSAVLLEKIRHQSREIEETAGQADSLFRVIARIHTKNRDLARITDQIDYVNRQA
ncbi:MAG: hypothetical protein KDK39_13455 [Leptospiraceae bacterium]|nr:hypothetical protein [Leptospiraceae bacterium]